MSTKMKVLIGIGIVVLLVILLFATGIIRIRITSQGSQTQSTEQPSPKSVTQKQTQAARPTEFDSKGFGTYSIQLPVGWSVSSDPKLTFVAGSLSGETLPNGEEFTPNLNIILGKHPKEGMMFADYQGSWKNDTMQQFPSMSFVKESSIKVNGMDTYVLEVDNTAPNGAVITQVQYVYYVDQNTVGVGTVSVPQAVWNKYEKVMSDTMESFRILTANTTSAL